MSVTLMGGRSCIIFCLDTLWSTRRRALIIDTFTNYWDTDRMKDQL